MGVLPTWRRRGAGRALVERAASWARAQGYSLLHVKTLAPDDPDPGYAATRAFYTAAGFRPLETCRRSGVRRTPACSWCDRSEPAAAAARPRARAGTRSCDPVPALAVPQAPAASSSASGVGAV